MASKLQIRLKQEATERVAALAEEVPGDRCVGCGTSVDLHAVSFTWRKQVGTSDTHHVRVEHVSTHSVCAQCLQELRARRRMWFAARYAGGIGLGAAIC